MTSFRIWSRRTLVVVVASALTAGLGGATAAPAAATIVVGDGFETPQLPSNVAFATFATGAQLGPWTVTKESVQLVNEIFWQQAEGDQSLDLNGAEPGAVAITIPVKLAAIYRVSYQLAGNPDGSPVIKTGYVRVNGQRVQEFSFDNTGTTRTNMSYVTKRFTVVAAATQVTLEFVSTSDAPNSDDDRFGPVLDDVVVSCLLACL